VRYVDFRKPEKAKHICLFTRRNTTMSTSLHVYVIFQVSHILHVFVQTTVQYIHAVQLISNKSFSCRRETARRWTSILDIVNSMNYMTIVKDNPSNCYTRVQQLRLNAVFNWSVVE